MSPIGVVMNSLNILIVCNIIIGICFLIVPAASIWLYTHRHRDWPRAWVLLLVGAGMGSSGISRLVQGVTYYKWPHIDPAAMALSDMSTAFVAVVSACFIPLGVWHILKLPTPTEWENTLRDSLAKKIFEAHAKEAQAEREKTTAKLERLKAVLKSTGLSAELQEKVLQALEDSP